MLWISTESKKPTWSVVAGQVGSWGSFAGISSRTTRSLPGWGPGFLSKGKPAHCYSWKTNYTSSSFSFGNPRWERSLLEGWANLHRFPWWETLVILSGVVETVLLKTKGLGTPTVEGQDLSLESGDPRLTLHRPSLTLAPCLNYMTQARSESLWASLSSLKKWGGLGDGLFNSLLLSIFRSYLFKMSKGHLKYWGTIIIINCISWSWFFFGDVIS